MRLCNRCGDTPIMCNCGDKAQFLPIADKQVDQSARAALADWFMQISEPLNSLGQPLPVIDGNGVRS